MCKKKNQALDKKSSPNLFSSILFNDAFVHFWVWIVIIMKAAKDLGRLEILQI